MFLDNNVLLYVTVGTKSDGVRREQALALIPGTPLEASEQVLAEFNVKVIPKSERLPASEDAFVRIGKPQVLRGATHDHSLARVTVGKRRQAWHLLSFVESV